MKTQKKRSWDRVPLNVVTAERLIERLQQDNPWEVMEGCIRYKHLLSRLELRYSPDYAECGYSLTEGRKGILFGNWNYLSKAGYDLLEESYDLEWCDEWSNCSDCDKAFRKHPDDMSWSPSNFYSEQGCADLCVCCLKENPSYYLDEVTQDEISYNIVRELVDSLPEGWELLEDLDKFNGTPRNAENHYKELGFEKVLCVHKNSYDFKWILGYKDEE